VALSTMIGSHAGIAAVCGSVTVSLLLAFLRRCRGSGEASGIGVVATPHNAAMPVWLLIVLGNAARSGLALPSSPCRWCAASAAAPRRSKSGA
jgi:hypothetical protein